MEKLAGDSMAAFWAGTDYARRTAQVAQEIAALMHRQSSIPVGVVVHAAVAYFDVMGGGEGLLDITAVGDEENSCARVCSQPAAAEIQVPGQEARTLELKGISNPVIVNRLPSGIN